MQPTCGIDDTHVAERRRFFELTDADLQRLSALYPFAEKVHADVVEELTRFLLQQEQGRRILADLATRQRASAAMRAYCLALFRDRLDAAYVDERLRIGVTHERLTVSPALVIGSFAFLLRAFHARLTEEVSDPTTLRDAYVSLEKRMHFDESLMIDAYLAAYLGDLREANTQMVAAGIQAWESADEADAARRRAEDREHELHAVSEARETFIGILGHDLRNPLGAISMAAGALEQSDDLLGSRDRKAVALVIESSRRMARMIPQLLDLTRMRLGGGLVLDRKPVDVGEVCERVVQEFQADIRLEVHGKVTGAWDRDRLAECLSNIVGNAVEHATPHTAIQVTCRAADGDVLVEVTNQGDPIPADVLPGIFRPFSGVRRHAAAGNLGLGLYIAHEIVT